MGAIHSHCAERAQPVENVWNLLNSAIGVEFLTLPCGNLSSFHIPFPRPTPHITAHGSVASSNQCSTWNNTPAHSQTAQLFHVEQNHGHPATLLGSHGLRVD
jgi:hypothetical protein